MIFCMSRTFLYLFWQLMSIVFIKMKSFDARAKMSIIQSNVNLVENHKPNQNILCMDRLRAIHLVLYSCWDNLFTKMSMLNLSWEFQVDIKVCEVSEHNVINVYSKAWINLLSCSQPLLVDFFGPSLSIKLKHNSQSIKNLTKTNLC